MSGRGDPREKHTIGCLVSPKARTASTSEGEYEGIHEVRGFEEVLFVSTVGAPPDTDCTAKVVFFHGSEADGSDFVAVPLSELGGDPPEIDSTAEVGDAFMTAYLGNHPYVGARVDVTGDAFEVKQPAIGTAVICGKAKYRPVPQA